MTSTGPSVSTASLPRVANPADAVLPETALQQPAVPVAAALIAGMLLDRVFEPVLGFWMLLALAVAIGLLLLLNRKPFFTPAAGLLVLLFWLTLGGLRHHQDWSVRRADNVQSCVSPGEYRPGRVTARVISPVIIEQSDTDPTTPTWMRIDRSLCRIECESLQTSAGELPYTGRLQLQVTGHLVGPQIGDRIEIFGTLHRPGPVRNPGGFDYAAFLRASGVDALLRADHPEQVRTLATAPTLLDRVRRLRDSLRRQCESLLERHLSPSLQPVAASLLLGDRSGLERKTETAFIASGTIHLLAISGLNVALLAGFLHLGCRLLKLSGAATVVLLATGILGYAFITDQQPSVMRAALMATLVLSGVAFGRVLQGYQTLALCAVILLLWKPSDLFDVGAQLSFLAVLAILWSHQWQQQQRSLIHDPFAADDSRSVFRVWPLTTLRSTLFSCYLLTLSVWIFTLPLTVHTFHFVAPVGLIVNVLLSPIVMVLLAAGYAGLLIGLFVPFLAGVPLLLFGGLLSLMLWIVEWSAALSLGHLWTPAPPAAWTAGFYLLLIVAIGVIPLRVSRRTAFRSLGVWSLAGLMFVLIPPRPDGLRCTFLSVGHGCAVLLETPSGRRLVYDVGSSTSGRRAQEAIQSALWASGGHALDGVLISHADVDHFNGVEELLKTVPVGSLFLTPAFLDFSQENIAPLCETAAARRIPIRLLQSGDRLDLGEEIELEILHPAGDFRSEDDNANSLVVRIRYAGRTLLLTGDLADDGLVALLSRPPESIDVLMSPHHGSLAANPPTLGRWAMPRYVVVSTSNTPRINQLADRFPPSTQIFSTDECGAVTATIRPNSELTVTAFVPRRVRLNP